MDFDNDGRTDVISGSFPGELYLFRRNANGKFESRETIKNARGEDIKAGSASTVFATDYDADGDLDLVLGNISGEVHLVTNGGTRDRPSYGEPSRLAQSDELKDRGGDSGPVVADWDADGLADLLVGNGDGSVVWFRNTGTAREPKLEAGKELVKKSPCGWNWEDRKPGQWGVRVKICVTDFNGDGKADLLLGDRSGTVGTNPPLTAEQQKKAAEARAALARVSTQRSLCTRQVQELEKKKASGDFSEDDEAKLEDLRAELARLTRDYAVAYKVVQTFQPTTSSKNGFLWLFARKAE